MGKTIDDVIFDLDGTLIDSQPAALGASIEALSRFGVQVTAPEIRMQFGGGSRKLMQHFLERDLSAGKAGRALDEATQLKISLQASFTDRVVLLPQARELLVLLKDSGYRLALATMAARTGRSSRSGGPSPNSRASAMTSAPISRPPLAASPTR